MVGLKNREYFLSAHQGRKNNRCKSRCCRYGLAGNRVKRKRCKECWRNKKGCNTCFHTWFLVHDSWQKPPRTLILLDEVDHLSGGLREISSERIKTIVSGEDVDDSKALKGDSGGKAELLNLLSETRQPVILACNDEMGLWGRTSSSWRTARDRFSKHLIPIRFERASNEALRRIALRVIKEEGFTADPGALDELVNNNQETYEHL